MILECVSIAEVCRGGAQWVFNLSGPLVSAGRVAEEPANPVANFFVGGDLADSGARVAAADADEGRVG